MILGNTERQKTPGNKVVDRMRANGGWLSKLDDPPNALLTASISSQSGSKGTAHSFIVALTNATTSNISFIDAASAAGAPGTAPSSDTIKSVELSFFAGSERYHTILQRRLCCCNGEKPPCLWAPGRERSLCLVLLVGRRHGTLRCKSPIGTKPPVDQLQPARQGHPEPPRAQRLRPIKLCSLRFQKPWGRTRAQLSSE